MLFECPAGEPLSNQDLTSWMFSDLNYDTNRPLFIDAVDPSHNLSCNDARRLIRQIVAGFHKLNLPKRSVVLINAFNSIYYPIVFAGIVASGHIFAGANPAYTSFELSHHLKVTGATFILAEDELLEKSKQAAKENGIPDSNILLFHPLNEPGSSSASGTKSWSEVLLSQGERDWDSFDDAELSRKTPTAHLTSSGTTGLPKACPWTHYGMIAQHELVQRTLFGARPYDVINLFALPMFHAASVPRVHASTIRTGYPSYIMKRFDLEEYLKYIDKYKVTELFAVPPIAVAMSMSPLTNKKYSLRSLRVGISGAAPLSKETQANLMQHMHPEATYTQVYGMTETHCCITVVSWPEDDRSGSAGSLLPGHQMKLVDDDGKDITGYDVRGECCFRGPMVVTGYIGQGSEKANAESFDEDGFYHSGDIVVIKKTSEKAGDWKMFVVDRKKELIKVRANQVAPAELEGVLLQHPGIVDAAVIGVPAKSDVDGEAPRAYLIRRPGYKPEVSEEDVKKFMASRLASFKRLDGGVRFVEAIPKNPSGKILKRILREQVKQEAEVGKPKM